MNTRKLTDILQAIPGAQVSGSIDISVQSIAIDSREVKPGTLFIAIRGESTDGHLFIADALRAGATAVICESMREIPESTKATLIQVQNSQAAAGPVAAAFYQHPSEELALVGVTGTNGKTTIATLLYHTFKQLGFQCGLISTIRYMVGDEEIPATHTTPDAIQLQKMIRKMVDSGCSYCFMEVSSHAVVQHRIAGLRFSGGIFTNLTHDHLDFHKTFEAYLKAKQSFFTALPPQAFALTCIDDRNGRVMTQNSRAKIKSYSTRSLADYRGKMIENTLEGLHLELDEQPVWTRLTGAFNASNITAVYATAMLLQFDKDEILTVLSNLEPVEGRFQLHREQGAPTAIVDYAHTPDALKNVLETIREVNHENHKVITVVGTGGNRDPYKRPLMTSIALEFSDKVILTSDNPRDEAPEKILADMSQGLSPADNRKTLTISDRYEAIKTAVMLAGEEGIILIAGKGHEKYQEIRGVKHPFDDLEVVKTLIKNSLT